MVDGNGLSTPQTHGREWFVETVLDCTLGSYRYLSTLLTEFQSTSFVRLWGVEPRTEPKLLILTAEIEKDLKDGEASTDSSGIYLECWRSIKLNHSDKNKTFAPGFKHKCATSTTTRQPEGRSMNIIGMTYDLGRLGRNHRYWAKANI
jgi:hypothetical protein